MVRLAGSEVGRGARGHDVSPWSVGSTVGCSVLDTGDYSPWFEESVCLGTLPECPVTKGRKARVFVGWIKTTVTEGVPRVSPGEEWWWRGGRFGGSRGWTFEGSGGPTRVEDGDGGRLVGPVRIILYRPSTVVGRVVCGGIEGKCGPYFRIEGQDGGGPGWC